MTTSSNGTASRPTRTLGNTRSVSNKHGAFLMTSLSLSNRMSARNEEYGENRFLAIGVIEGLLITVVYCERGERIRLISARRATSNERRKYYSGQTPF